MTDPSYDTVSQSAHFFSAAAVVLWLRYGRWGFTHEHLLWFVGAFGLVCVAKEFWWDYVYESVEARGSSLRDFAFYFLGMVVGGFA